MKKNRLIEEVLKDIDLSPTLEKNAREKYQSIAKYLEDKGLDCAFYPQGSFLLGTVVRPFRENKDRNYDLDIINIVNSDKYTITPSTVKIRTGNLLKDNNIYKERLLKEDNHCWTLKYADVGDIGFTLDLVPGILEESTQYEYINQLSIEQSTILITEKVSGIDYKWILSNPLGYGTWFKDISQQHLTEGNRLEQREEILKELRTFYASAEEIPEYYYRSSLQRAVQFLKRSRDIYYDRSDRLHLKPSTFLLTSLIASAVEHDYNLGIEEILSKFINGYKTKSISIMWDNKIINPIDVSENLISNWKSDQKTTMDLWIKYLQTYFVDEIDEVRFKRNLKNDIIPGITVDKLNAKKVEGIKPWRDNH